MSDTQTTEYDIASERIKSQRRIEPEPAQTTYWQPIETAPRDGTEILSGKHFLDGWGIRALSDGSADHGSPVLAITLTHRVSG